MVEKLFEIRSNINDSFGEFARLAKEREEREKAERDAKYKKDYEEKTRLATEWQNKYKNLFKYTYASYYNKDTFNYDYGVSCEVRFFEWSNIHREPLIFNRYGRFYKFLDESDIFLSCDLNDLLKRYNKAFIVCKPGSKDLIICGSYEDLQREFHKAENLVNIGNILSTVPEI